MVLEINSRKVICATFSDYFLYMLRLFFLNISFFPGKFSKRAPQNAGIMKPQKLFSFYAFFATLIRPDRLLPSNVKPFYDCGSTLND